MTVPLPPLAWRAFRLPKGGHTLGEYEDAFAGNPRAGRFAVADGASESAFASAWARLLARAYVRTPGPWPAWLPKARKRWRVRLRGQELPWYAEAKVQEGAFATLLGVAFDEGRGRWQAEAVGDSCLFQVRDGRLCRAFPLRRSEDFGIRPDLLCSRPADHSARVRRFRRGGDWREGDLLVLMTDTLAQWFLREVEEGRKPWEGIISLPDQARFAGWVEGLRQANKLRNDDVTLVCVQSSTDTQPRGST